MRGGGHMFMCEEEKKQIEKISCVFGVKRELKENEKDIKCVCMYVKKTKR